MVYPRTEAPPPDEKVTRVETDPVLASQMSVIYVLNPAPGAAVNVVMLVLVVVTYPSTRASSAANSLISNLPAESEAINLAVRSAPKKDATASFLVTTLRDCTEAAPSMFFTFTLRDVPVDVSPVPAAS